MGSPVLPSSFLFLLVAASCFAADLTRQPNAYGPDVVEAVVNIIRESCLFADDKRFLRRLAYVESHDGTSPDTFRAGYHGGIWQVDEKNFQSTQTNSASLTAEYQIIQNVMGIDWSRVQWSDLRKPLYSGIAAALFSLLKAGTGGVSWKVEEQGTFWSSYFHTGHANTASNFSSLASILDLGCHTNQQVDLVFVVDTSSSLTHDDFDRAVQFLSNVVNGFDISPRKTQVAVVSYSSAARVEFYLNSHSTKSEVQGAITGIPYNTGSTRTDLAIDTALNNVFNPSHGARDNVVKVMVVITDGNSDDSINTRHAAERAHARGIVTFSVGVGKQIQKQELNTIATDPECTHTYQVNSYEEIRFLTEEIQKATCIAPLFINRTYSCEISHCPPLAILTGKTGVTVQTNISCGGMTVFSSNNNPYPSSAQYTLKQTSLAGSMTEHFYKLIDQILYLNMKDNQGLPPHYNGSTGCIATITPLHGDHTDHIVTVKCFQNHVEIQCKPSYFNCTENWNFTNPCTHDNLLAGKTKFPHPYKSNEFLFCDLSGKVYIALCPPGEIFLPDCSQCIGAGVAVTAKCDTTPPPGVLTTNQCSRENILAGKMYFPFPGDVTKYIHCDIWGHPWSRQCPAGMEWDQTIVTCIVHAAYNPCFHHVPGTPFLYKHQCDPHKYIHCDTNDQSYVQSCQLDYVFLESSRTCVPKGQFGTDTLVYTCGGTGGTGTGTGTGTGSGTGVIVTGTHPPPVQNTYGPTSSTLIGYEYSSTQFAPPCTKANIAANLLYFPYKYNTHQYIQCDLGGHMYLKDCSTGGRDYYDKYSHTCVDGPVIVDPFLTNPPIG